MELSDHATSCSQIITKETYTFSNRPNSKSVVVPNYKRFFYTLDTRVPEKVESTDLILKTLLIKSQLLQHKDSLKLFIALKSKQDRKT